MKLPALFCTASAASLPSLHGCVRTGYCHDSLMCIIHYHAMVTNRISGSLGSLDLSAVDLTRLASALSGASELAAPSQGVRALCWVAKHLCEVRQGVRGGNWPAVKRSVSAFQDVAAAKLHHPTTAAAGPLAQAGRPSPSPSPSASQFSPEFCT